MGSCDCGKGCAKFLLILFNVLFFLTGAALLAVGIWIRVDDSIWEFINFASLDQDDKFIEYGAYLLIGVGGFILLTGMFGCCGAIRESKFCLGMYIFILVIVFIAEIAAGVLVIIFQDTVKDEFTNIVKEQFKDEEKFYHRGNEFSGFATSLNLVQKEFDCCGIDGAKDYDDLGQNATSDNRYVKCSSTLPYPCSCYPLKNADNDKNPNLLTLEDIQGTKHYDLGCRAEVIDFFEEYSVIFIGLAIGFACIEVFGLIFAVCLCVIGGKGE